MSPERASIASVFRKGASKAVADGRTTAEMPTGDTFEELNQSADDQIRYELLAKRPGEPDSQEIMQSDNGPAYRKFLLAKGIDITQALPPDSLAALGQFRIEFLTAVHRAEHVKGFITPELVHDIISAGFSRNDPAFKLLVDTVNPETLVKIVQKHMIDFAASDPLGFRVFARNIEIGARHKQSPEYLETDKQVRKMFVKYGVDDGRYQKLLNAVRDPALDPDEKEALIRKQVRSSKAFIGWAQWGIDKGAEFLQKKLDDLENEIIRLEAQVRTLDQQINTANTDIARLRADAALVQDDETNPIHQQLQDADDLQDDRYETRRGALKSLIKKRGARDLIEEKILPAAEWMSSKGGGERLEDTIEQADAAKQELDEAMVNLGTALRLGMDADPTIREAMRKVQNNETPREIPGTTTYKDEVRGERSFTNAFPSPAQHQTNYNRFVAEARLAGDQTPRDSRALQGKFRKQEARRLGKEYGAKQTRGVPLFGFMFSMIFSSGHVQRKLETGYTLK